MFTHQQENDMIFSFKTNNKMNFEIKNLPQKEYIEKEPKPCEVGFSVNPIFAYTTACIFQKEEEAIYD